MGTLVYGLLTSLDGYVNGPDGDFAWAEPDEATHRFINDRQRGIGTFLFGRRMFDVMRVWDEFATRDDLPDHIRDYAQLWQSADKLVFSTTMDEPANPRTRLARDLDVEAIRELKAGPADLAVGGPALAADLLRAGLVDELELYVLPVVVGGGTPFLPAGLQLDLSLVEEQQLGSGAVFLRYAVRR